MLGSSVRSVPAAAVARIHKPAPAPRRSRSSFTRRNAASGITTSPRTSNALRNSGLLQLLCGNRKRHAANGADVDGYILARLPVAARHAAGQPRPAVVRGLIAQRNAQPVQLQLGRVLHRQRPGQLAHPPVPVRQLLGRIRIVQAQHRPRVPHLLESLGRLAAHALRRRVRRQQLRMLGLDPLQLVHQRVVLGVGDLRRVQHVVKVLVAAQFRAQFLRALRKFAS